jgi:hypothetical protein
VSSLSTGQFRPLGEQARALLRVNVKTQHELTKFSGLAVDASIAVTPEADRHASKLAVRYYLAADQSAAAVPGFSLTLGIVIT